MTLQFKGIENTLRFEKKEIYQIDLLDDSNGKQQSFECTANHPFYVIDKGFVRTDNLTLTDQCLDCYGNKLVIAAIQKTAKVDTVYDLTVANTHTFFVGKAGAWVHNSSSTGDDLINYLVDADKTLVMKEPNTNKPIKNLTDITDEIKQYDNVHSKYKFGHEKGEYRLYLNTGLIEGLKKNTNYTSSIYSSGGWNKNFMNFMNSKYEMNFQEIYNKDDLIGLLGGKAKDRIMSKGRAGNRGLVDMRNSVLYDDQLHQVLGFRLYGGRAVRVKDSWYKPKSN